MLSKLDGNSETQCARAEQSLLFDLLKAFDQTKSSYKSDAFSPKRPIFSSCMRNIVVSYHLNQVPCPTQSSKYVSQTV